MIHVLNFVEIIILMVTLSLLFALCKSKRKLRLTRILLLFIIITIILVHLSAQVFSNPKIILKGDAEVSIEVNSQYSDSGVRVRYHNKKIANDIQILNNVDTSKIGTYQVIYQLPFNGTTIQEFRVVNVIDSTPPSITLNGDEEIKLAKNEQYSEPGFTASDNYDGNITNKVKVERENVNEKEYLLHYSVADSSGNQSQILTRKIVITDEISSNPKKNKTSVIYLTFDDGPSLDITPKILDIFKEENVKATFFVLNYSENKEYLIKRIVDEGHTIGIHGYSHDYKKIYSSDEAFINNVTKLQEKIKKSTGVTTKYMRFPGGSSNTISKKYSKGIMTRLTKKMLDDGFYYYDWNVSAEDAAGAKTKKDVYNNVIKDLHKNRSNIVLMHDFAKNNKTLDALKDIIKYGNDNGYTFKNIDDSTPMITQPVNN